MAITKPLFSINSSTIDTPPQFKRYSFSAVKFGLFSPAILSSCRCSTAISVLLIFLCKAIEFNFVAAIWRLVRLLAEFSVFIICFLGGFFEYFATDNFEI